MERNLMAMGQLIAGCQDEMVRQRLDLHRGRARLLASVSERRDSARFYRTLAVAALLFSAAVIGFWLRGPSPGSRMGLMASAVKTGEWIAAPTDGAVPIRFTDGTKLELLPNGRARVTEIVQNGATVVVERGELRASVRPHQGNHWRIDVGPFRVTVVGTIFDVSWQPEIERFSLTLRKGAVLVAGPVVGMERAVRAGERLDVWVGQGELKSTRIGAPARSAEVSRGTEAAPPTGPDRSRDSIVSGSENLDEPASVIEPVRPRDFEVAGGRERSSEPASGRGSSRASGKAGPSRSRRAGVPTALKELTSKGSQASGPAPRERRSDARAQASGVIGHAAPEPMERATATGVSAPSSEVDSFRLLARANRYRDSLAEAERVGVAAICAAGNASDVLLLGDVARLAGNEGLAEKAYLALRRRFVGGPATQAAFMLGRLAQDQRAAYAEAAEYFVLYLREAPGGVFAREAASRLIESRMSAGNREGAKAAAAQYVSRYPTGPYADKARELLNEP